MRLFQAALDTCLDSPFLASLSIHGLHFTVYAPSSFVRYRQDRRTKKTAKRRCTEFSPFFFLGPHKWPASIQQLKRPPKPLRLKGVIFKLTSDWELRNIYHHHPESKKRKSSEENSGFIHPYGRYGNAVKTRKTISTIAILWPVEAIFEKRAATVEVDSFISPE